MEGLAVFKRPLLALMFIASLLAPAFAAQSQYFNPDTPLGPDVTGYIKILMSPGVPDPITIGVLYLVILMGIMYALVFYTGLNKSKLFGGDEYGGGGSGKAIVPAVAAVLT